MRTVKSLLQWTVRTFFALFPNGVLFGFFLPIIRLLPRRIGSSLVDLLPANRTSVFGEYEGDIRVNIDTFYPIERMILRGWYEPMTQAVISRFVHSGDVCVDIGANIGAVTLPLARRAKPDGQVVSFEPGPPLFARLEKNVALNPEIARITQTINLGVANEVSTLYWKEDERYPGNAGFRGVKESEGVAIPVTTIDEYFKQNPVGTIHFMKIDVEGMEHEVLSGGLETLKEQHPILYYETMREFEESRDKPVFLLIEKMLTEIGYVLFKVEEDGSVQRTSYPDLSEYTLAVSEDQAKKLV